MRPEIREPLLALRDALTPRGEAALGLAAAFPADPEEARHWRVTSSLLRALAASLRDPERSLEQIDEDVEDLGAFVSGGVRLSTPWFFQIAAVQPGDPERLTLFNDDRVGSLCLVALPHIPDAEAHRLRRPLYQLICALLGAEAHP